MKLKAMLSKMLKWLLFFSKAILYLLLCICVTTAFIVGNTVFCLVLLFLFIAYVMVQRYVCSRVWQISLRVLLLLLFFLICIVVSGEPMNDIDLCADTGVCKETVLNEEKCLKEGGKWVKLRDGWHCYLKWSLYHPKII